MPTRAARLAATLLLVLAGLGATPVRAADPSAVVIPSAGMSAAPGAAGTPALGAAPSPAPSPTASLPPMVGAPGTTSAGTTIRGAIGVVIGAIIVIIGWRRRRRPSPRPPGTPLTRR